MTGLEPATPPSQMERSTKLNYILFFTIIMERMRNFEIPTPDLEGQCSASELHPRIVSIKFIGIFYFLKNLSLQNCRDKNIFAVI